MKSRIALVLVGAALVTACSEPSSPGALRPNFSVEPPPGGVTLCKVGTAATFTVVDGSTTTNMTLADGECTLVAGNDGLNFRDITITEAIPANTVLDSITKDTVANYEDGATHSKVTGTNTVTVAIPDETASALVTFYNRAVAPPAGGQGCTPGYWKQKQHYGSWPAPYTPNTLFSSVFENAFPGKTLVQVLGQGGGGLTALGRHTVAALLNSAQPAVSYDITGAANVINAFNAVFPSNNSQYEPLHNYFANFNEQGCPLGRNP